MYFDTSPRVLHTLNRSLRQDPRVIRWTMTKLGEKIEDIADIQKKTVSRTPLSEPSENNTVPTENDKESQSNT